MKAGRVSVVVFNLPQVKRRASFLGHPVYIIYNAKLIRRHAFVARLRINLPAKHFFRDSKNKTFKSDGFCQDICQGKHHHCLQLKLLNFTVTHQ